MTFTEYKIPAPYDTFLKSIYAFECIEINRQQLFLPDGNPELTIATTPIWVSHQESPIILPNTALFWGQLQFSGKILAHKPYKVFGIKFQPWVLYFLSHNSTKELVDRILPAKEVFSTDFMNKVFYMASCTSSMQLTHALIDVHYQFQSDFSSKNDHIKHNLTAFIKNIEDSRGSKKILDFIPQYKQSQRTLENDFSKYIGIRPKVFQSIVRLRKSGVEIKKGKKILDTALDLGYYDQAHFNKDFKRLISKTPRQYLKEKNLVLSTV
ncbi:helix-turn-helix domain-containing protein [Aquimarina hainanensis]|uniref:Helix-turn-helix domain-containing protein n=1 Tax=Aquimarina hainanensis TaxID=1578017 RepID=A0ABW5NB72_9FLAO|nr:helix-turn-helix domain-containing protein [Aquimarina sp. TRL1]QKX06695.1 AraC family transcriptional regulator [Aquimarina sp. TRL1]